MYSGGGNKTVYVTMSRRENAATMPTKSSMLRFDQPGGGMIARMKHNVMDVVKNVGFLTRVQGEVSNVVLAGMMIGI